ncbi:hypothetical protein HU200_051738 [Digitaria exilis]|uniref:Uncharacterized protein n=1 Tax=Digitaria exilis TaxID=1010633 RepID=A0A835E9I9_9POAL|nr:hypothetical protein HU200_051738 [Digitaria exilis]
MQSYPVLRPPLSRDASSPKWTSGRPSPPPIALQSPHPPPRHLSLTIATSPSPLQSKRHFLCSAPAAPTSPATQPAMVHVDGRPSLLHGLPGSHTLRPTLLASAASPPANAQHPAYKRLPRLPPQRRVAPPCPPPRHLAVAGVSVLPGLSTAESALCCLLVLLLHHERLHGSPGAHRCHVGSSVAETLDRTYALRHLASTFQTSKPPPPPFFLPLFSFFSLQTLQTLPGAAAGAPSAAAGADPHDKKWTDRAQKNYPDVSSKDAPVPPALPSPQFECGKPTRVTQSMHPDSAARAYYKCGDHRVQMGGGGGGAQRQTEEPRAWAAAASRYARAWAAAASRYARAPLQLEIEF